MWQTIGHDWAVELLSNSLKRGRLSHTFLFTGPTGIGKSHLAKELAAAINCREVDAPCKMCSSCKGILAGAHPDLTVVAPDKGTIRIEQIRNTQHELSLRPYQSSHRVCIITEFETATTEAANALLKTLEEPPASAIIILTARDTSLLLPTVVSRCQHIGLRLVSGHIIERALEERYGMPAEQAAKLAGMAAGRIGWAFRAAEDDSLVQQRLERTQALMGILRSTPADRIIEAEKLAKADDLEEMLGFWQSWWHDVLIASIGKPELAVDIDWTSLADSSGRPLQSTAADQAERHIEETLEELGQNVNPRLAVEVLLLRLPLLAS